MKRRKIRRRKAKRRKVKRRKIRRRKKARRRKVRRRNVSLSLYLDLPSFFLIYNFKLTLITASFLFSETLAVSYFSFILVNRSLSLLISDKSFSRLRIFSFKAARRNVPRARSISDDLNLKFRKLEE